MAQFVTDETQVVAGELERVKDVIEYLMDFDDVFYSTIDKADNIEVVSARDMRVPLALNPGGNYGYWNPDGGDLGAGSGPQFDKALVQVANLRHGIRYTKKAQWATDSARKAVLNTTKTLLKDGAREFRRHLDSACMGDGTAALATISAISTAGGKDTYTLAHPTDSLRGFRGRLLRFGQPVSVFNNGVSASRVMVQASDGVDMNPGGANASEIDFVDLGANQVRIKAATTSVAVGDKIVTSGLNTNGTMTGGALIQGISYHHSDASTGSWLGFLRANFPQIRASRVTASGPFALPQARLALNKISDRVGIKKRTGLKAWMHMAQAAAYEEVAQANIVINKMAKQQGVDMYFDELNLAGVPVEISPSWDRTRIDFIDGKIWGRSVMKPAGFYEENDQKLFEVRSATGTVKAAVDFFLVISWQLFDGNPAAGAYVSDLTIPNGY